MTFSGLTLSFVRVPIRTATFRHTTFSTDGNGNAQSTIVEGPVR
jgi:hypothetical protein